MGKKEEGEKEKEEKEEEEKEEEEEEEVDDYEEEEEKYEEEFDDCDYDEEKKEEKEEERVDDYDDDEEEEYKTFEKSELFVKNNKYKYKIIYKNKIFPIQSLFEIRKINIEKIKFKLISYNHISNLNKIQKELPITKHYKIERLKYIKNMNMYKFIKYLFNKCHEIQKMIYKISDEDKIKIFGEEFVGNNGNKCLIIYRDKIFPLQTYFLIKDIDKEDKDNKKFEIILLELEEISDISYMFFNCKLLIEFIASEENGNIIKGHQAEDWILKMKTNMMIFIQIILMMIL